MNPATETVFVVDDDNGMRSSIRVLLKSVGQSAEPFASAREFLDFYQPNRAGCVILDSRMPGMDGLELQQELSRLGSTLPIIFLTGHADVQLAVEAMRRGAFDLLEKPVRDQALLDCVQRALARGREARAAVTQAE